MYAQIALPLPVRRLFTYQIPSDLMGKIKSGQKVLVPLEKRHATGFVVEIVPRTKIKGVKKIIDVLDPEPCFSEKMLELTRHVSQYYFCSWGEALKAALPPELQTESSIWIKKSEYNEKEIENLSPRQNEILKLLVKKPQIKLNTLRKKIYHKEIWADLSHLKKQKAIEFLFQPPLSRKVSGQEKIVKLKDPLPGEDELNNIKNKAPKQWQFFQILKENKGELSLKDFKENFKSPIPTLKELEKKEIVQIIQKKKAKDGKKPFYSVPGSANNLNSEESKISSQIKKALQKQNHQVFLLQGGTYRDRLKIYVDMIKEVLQKQREVCILVPEISLIKRFEIYLRSYFGDDIACFHSRLPAYERYENWMKTKDGELSIVLGTRLAVFAPSKSLDLIIVEQEHDTSHKQEDLNPRYHARDVAIKRGEMENAIIILGSATPSLESFYQAREGKYVLCRLKENEKPKAKVEIVDMHQEKKEDPPQPISRKLSHLIEEKLSNKEKVALFLNRRGFSKVVKCQDCGFVYRCPNCNISLTFHQADLSLKCHFCNYKTRVGATCPECNGHSFSYAGTGTERIYQKIKEKFPRASILRMDLDTAKGMDIYQMISEGSKNLDFDLLLGTRMIVREWDLPRVSLVGVISADFSLDFPDFRSREKTFQILTQVLRMARENGEVLIQTHYPEDWSLKLAAQENFPRFYDQEIDNRKELNYPPFSHLIMILFSGGDKKTLSKFSQRFAARLKNKLDSIKNTEILGPAPAPLFRIRGKHRYQLLLKTQKPDEAVELMDAVSQMKSLKKSSSVRITINVDPMEMM